MASTLSSQYLGIFCRTENTQKLAKAFSVFCCIAAFALWDLQDGIFCRASLARNTEGSEKAIMTWLVFLQGRWIVFLQGRWIVFLQGRWIVFLLGMWYVVFLPGDSISTSKLFSRYRKIHHKYFYFTIRGIFLAKLGILPQPA